MKRILGWIAAGIGALLIIAVLAAAFVARSAWFHNYVLQTISQKIYASTGARAVIRSFDFSLSGLRANVYGITVHGTEAANQRPLLQVDKLSVRMSIRSLLSPKIALKELAIERPVVHLMIDANGKTNLPEAPSPHKTNSTNIFDLAVGHVRLSYGEVNYNDAKIPLDADLRDLGTDIHFDSLTKCYSGNLSYANGHIRYAQYSPLPHSLNAKFRATPDRFTLEPAILNVGSSQLELHAGMSDYSNPQADADYAMRIHAQDFATLDPSAKPEGDILLRGKMHYQYSSEQPLLRSISTAGQIASPAITSVLSGASVETRNLEGRYQLANGMLKVADVTLDLLGGNIRGAGEILDLDTTPKSELRASLRGISLRAAQQALHRPEFKNVKVSGVLNGTADASWKGSASNVRAHARLAVRPEPRGTSNSPSELPVTGVIDGAYDGASGALTFQNIQLEIASATVAAQGELSRRSNLQVHVSANDLHQLVRLASSLGATSSTMPAISGSASLNALVHGSMRSPSFTAQVAAQNLAVQGSQWTSARLDMQASPSYLQIQNATLVDSRGGQAAFGGRVGLRNWSYQPTNSIEANLSARGLRVEDLQKLANQHYPISGEISAKISVQGSQTDPRGSGTVQVVNARAYDEPLETMAMKFNAASGTVVSTLNAKTDAGALQADVSYTPQSKSYKVRLDAPGIILQRLRTLQAKNLALTGTLTVKASGEGTIDNPQLAANLSIPQLGAQQTTIGNLNADARIAGHQADFNLQSTIAQASVIAHGRVNLSGDYYAEAAIDTGTVKLEQLLPTYVHNVPQGLQGQTEFHASLKGPLENKSQVEAHLSVPILKASYQSLDIGLAQPLRADYSNSLLTLQPVEIQGTGTSLNVQGSVPVGGNASPKLTAQGSVDLRVLRILVPDSQTAGALKIDVRTSGTASNPALQGQVRVQNASFAPNEGPISLSNLNGLLDIDSDRVQFTNMTGEIGGGRVSVGGSIAYRPALQFNVAVQGQSMRLLYPEGLRSSLDTNLTFSGTTEASILSGRVLVDSLGFTPDFDLAKFATQFSNGTNIPPQPGFADTVKLSLIVQSKENLSATSSQVSIGGRANLQVGGTAANPVITGRVNLNAGELFYRNVRYQLQGGVITFDNPNETQPNVNVSVTSTVEQYNLTVNLRGPMDKLTTSYSSDPPLATADIINLIARGQTTQEADAGSQSTDSILASGAASELSSSVQKLAGFSSLQIDPLLGGNNQNPSARVALQQRVSKNLLFTFSTDVAEPGSEVVQGEYQINKHWSASVTRDETGGVSVDGRYHKRF